MTRVVVLPLDKAALPEKAEEINAKLAMVMLPGAEAPTLSTISMETAQLQAECADATETCYLKIAKLVEADRLLWAQVENGSAKGNKKKKGKPSFKLQITLFDRDKLAVGGSAEETFPGAITDEELDKLIAKATGVAPGAHASTTPPPAAAPPAAPPPQAHPAAVPAPTYAPQLARPAPAPAPAPAGRPVYQPQPAAQPVYQPQPAAQPVYQPQPAGPTGYQPQPAAQPTYNRQPAAAPAPAAYPPSAAPAPGYQPAPAAAPPAAAPPAARYQ
jgi:hypothetical protein